MKNCHMAFANNMSTDIKLSEGRISKMIQSGVSLLLGLVI